MMKGICIKKTSSGVIIEKEGERLKFDGKSGELINKILDKEWGKDKQQGTLLGKLISSLSQLTINERFKENLNIIKRGKMFLFLSKDDIGEGILKNFKQMGCDIKKFYLPVKTEQVLKCGIPKYILIYHNQPAREFLFFLNKLSLENNIRFARCFRGTGSFAVAPFVIPFETACYKCYSFLKTNNQVYDYDTLGERDIRLGGISNIPSLLSSFCVDLFCLRAIQFLGDKIQKKENLQEVFLDLNNLEISYNPILKVPNCSHCGNGSKI